MPNNKLPHPKSLKTFFTTEMWERYGFYVVQTLLAIYLAMHLGWNDARVYKLVGSFTALTYVSPVIGGWIADHLIGQRKAVLVATIILFISYLIIGVVSSDKFLCISLAGITVGSGLLKPNISSLLGNEYTKCPENRESGFTIFYMGITVGIILGTTLPSFISQKYGWSSAFISAAIGMVLAFATFLHGIYVYKIRDYHDYTFELDKVLRAILIICSLWFFAYYILKFPYLADTVFLTVAGICLAYLCKCVFQESEKQSKRTIVIGLLCIISILFWTFYFQMFLSLTLFIVRVVKPTLLGFNFPPPFYVGIQSVGMIVLGIIISRNRGKLSKPKHAERTGNKFLLSIFCMTLAYGLIVVINKMNLAPGLISPIYLIPAYLIISLAELLLSPVGLSAVTLLASKKRVSTMLGIFFVSLGIGGYLSGKLASITALPIGISGMEEIKHHYATAFSKLFVILIFGMLICAVINYLIKKLMSDK